ncbi:hypothetical protein BIW11_03828 [Tropilaelaps mercedesae]|uniref:Uncharacterized protein n=1 Tax=Tropilaelaps mercedesae TaxID=418985 RepID=A0A1V9XF23_9ACAR|nr:hypothetical protein BIW11_03828 [Tropilaelaps mercedesae]
MEAWLPVVNANVDPSSKPASSHRQPRSTKQSPQRSFTVNAGRCTGELLPASRSLRAGSSGEGEPAWRCRVLFAFLAVRHGRIEGKGDIGRAHLELGVGSRIKAARAVCPVTSRCTQQQQRSVDDKRDIAL